MHCIPAIVYTLPAPSAADIDSPYARLLHLIARGRLSPGTPLTEAVVAQRLGVSRTSLRRLTARIASGALREESFAALTEEQGIGPWTAAVILLRGFGRTEVFAPHDTGDARGLGALLAVPPGPLSTTRIDRFGKYRGYLYFYSLGAQLFGRGLITPTPGVQGSTRSPRRRAEP